MGFDVPAKKYSVSTIAGGYVYAHRLCALKKYAIEPDFFSKSFWSCLNARESAEQTMKKVQEIMKSVEESVAAQEAEEKKLKKKKAKSSS
jgi:hypothetical protein